MHIYTVLEPSLASYCIFLTVPAKFRLYHLEQLKVALVGNNDTMDDWWVVASGGCILKIGLRTASKV